MDIRKIINRRIRHAGDGIDVVGDVNAVISANVEERGGTSHVSSKQRVVHRSGETTVSERETSEGGNGDPPHTN
jgi:hypothetical protein